MVVHAHDPDGIERRAGDYQSVESMTAALDGIHTAVMISAPVIGGSDRLPLLNIVFRVTPEPGPLRPADDVSELAWFAVDELPPPERTRTPTR